MEVRHVAAPLLARTFAQRPLAARALKAATPTGTWITESPRKRPSPFTRDVRRRQDRFVRKGTRWLAAGGTAWAIAIAIGFALLLRYKSAPGGASAAPGEWPAASAIARDGERA